MTRFNRFLFTALLLTGCAGIVRAQSGRYDLQLVLKEADCPAQKIQVQLQIRASNTGVAFKLSDATLRLTFPLSELVNPVLIEETNFSGNAPASDAAYDAQIFVSQAGLTKGSVGLTLGGLNTPAALRQVGVDWITVAVIRFDVVKPRGCSTLSINTTGDFPPSGVSEAYLSGSSYTYTEATSSGVYGNLLACLGAPVSCVVISCQRIR